MVDRSVMAERPDAERGSLIVVSAPSGAGKSSLVERALKQVKRLRYSISYTTRAPRGAERDGVDYFFVTDEVFQAMREAGEFIEYAEVHGHMYGTHSATIEKMLAEGCDVILDIDAQGAEQIRRKLPEAITIFVLPPSRKVLEARLRRRNLNSPDDLARRLRNATAEVKLYKRFKYVIINDDRDRAFAALKAIITAERRRPDRQESRVRSILDTFGGD
ncbi:MAG TPA: guanylate kinase [Blastocatellia bacterium]|nr:guanylate kinase [Blastocatellia bacterium]